MPKRKSITNNKYFKDIPKERETMSDEYKEYKKKLNQLVALKSRLQVTKDKRLELDQESRQLKELEDQIRKELMDMIPSTYI